MLLVTRYDTWSFFPFSVFSRSAKLGKEGSRVSGVVMTRLWGRAADYPVRHIKFSFPFFKRRQGGGAEPCLARRNGRNSFIPKAREGGGNSPVGSFLLGDPRMGFPFFMFSEMFQGEKPSVWCRHDWAFESAPGCRHAGAFSTQKAPSGPKTGRG